MRGTKERLGGGGRGGQGKGRLVKRDGTRKVKGESGNSKEGVRTKAYKGI